MDKLIDSVSKIFALDREVAARLVGPFVKNDAAPAGTFDELKKRMSPVQAGQLEYNLSIVRRGERIFQMANRRLPARENPKVLDIGSGFGGMLIPFGHQGFELHGIELDAARRRMCDQTLAAFDLKATFYDVDLCQRRIDGQFDVIICNSVIEHVSDPDTMIVRMADLLRDGGVLVFGVANKDAIGCVLADPHYGTFGLTLLPNGLARRVYETVESRPQGYSVTEFYPIGNYVNQLADAIGPVEAVPGEDGRTIADFPELFGRLGMGFAGIVGRLRNPLLRRQFQLHFAGYTQTLLRAYAEAIDRGTARQFEDTYIRKSYHLIAVKAGSSTADR